MAKSALSETVPAETVAPPAPVMPKGVKAMIVPQSARATDGYTRFRIRTNHPSHHAIVLAYVLAVDVNEAKACYLKANNLEGKVTDADLVVIRMPD
jgi:hypothetical protein